jgi:predicted dehydrogenase
VATFLERVVRDAPPPTRELGVGVVGYGPYGGMGTYHGLAATETAGLRLAAAADTVRERLTAAEGDFPGINLHDSAESLADDPDVDVAVVATPPSVHADLARKLLQSGVHVVLEKPMCLTVADADELLQLAAEQERTLTVHQSRRWDRDFLALRRVVEGGDLGEVFNLETFVGTYEHPCRAWHSDRAISGGAVYDWGSHHVDWIVRLYGSVPSSVVTSAHTRRWHDSTNVDQLHVWMRWDDGREATFRQSDLAAIRRPKFYVQGTQGTVEGHYRTLQNEQVVVGRGYVDHEHHHAEAPVDLELARHETGYGVTRTTLPTAPHPGWGFHRNLADHLLLGEPLAVPAEQSRDVVAVLEAAHRSMLAGGTVEAVDALP